MGRRQEKGGREIEINLCAYCMQNSVCVVLTSEKRLMMRSAFLRRVRKALQQRFL